MFTGPKIVTEGLVFGFDTGYPMVKNNQDTYKFNKGEPAYNWIDFQNAVAQSSYTAWTGPNSGNFVANHPDAIQVVNSLGNSITGYYNSGVGDAANTHHAHWVYDETLKKPVVQMRDLDAQWKAKNFGISKTPDELGLAHGGSYTISWLQWSDTVGKGADVGLYGSSPSGFHDGRSYSTTTQLVANQWEQKSYTETSLSTSFNTGSNVSIYMYGHTTPPNTSGIIRIADVQLEINSHSTPLATPSRSVSGSLLDLTRTRDIDLSLMSFDTSGQLEFDGTDDRIDTALYHLSGSDHTEEVVVYRGSEGTQQGILCDLQYGFYGLLFLSNDKIRYRQMQQLSNPTSYPNVSLDTPDTYGVGTYHIVGSFSSANGFRLYVNGELKNSDSTDLPFNLSGNRGINHIGLYKSSNSSTYHNHLDGKLHIVKCYDKELTAAQVKQNYNAIKDRFNI